MTTVKECRQKLQEELNDFCVSGLSIQVTSSALLRGDSEDDFPMSQIILLLKLGDKELKIKSVFDDDYEPSLYFEINGKEI